MKQLWKMLLWLGRISLGSALFALAFAVFLDPNELNAGGVTGIAQILVHWIGIGSVGTVTALVNLPLFALGGLKIGRKFFVGSLVGMASSAVLLDLFSLLPIPQVEPLLACLYGGALCGLGLGVVFAAGASTGGSDIVVRLLKLKLRHVPIGTINICFDAVVILLTGLAFQDITKSLYSGIAIFLSGQIIDAVVYRFDYSKVALIISSEHEAIAQAVARELDRGATFLRGEGSYSGAERKVVLTAVRKHQLSDLKRIVSEIDPNAFIIVQEAHQVLGDGFSKYSGDEL